MSTLLDFPLRADRWHLDWLEDQSLMLVRPKVVRGIAMHGEQYYDQSLARVDGETIVADEADGWSLSAPALKAGARYCRLLMAEYAEVCRTGQMPATVTLADDPMQALASAWTDAPTFKEPAIIVRVTNPMPARRGGFTSLVTDVLVGRPYRIVPGRVTMLRADDQWVQGARVSPTASLVWKRVDPGVAIAEEPHAHRLGWCLTCDVPSYDCGNERSGNRGHKGRPGERGGSAPSELHAAGDALESLLNGEKVNIHREEVREFVERARNQHEDPDITDMHVEGMLLFGGNGLGIKREDMPQIPREHRERFLEYLEHEGVIVKVERVSPLSLAPTQKEVSARIVGEKLKAYEDDPDKEFPPLLVAEDSHVLDGHHHWGAMATIAIDSPKAKVPIYRLMTTTKRALDIMHAYNKLHGIKRKALSGPKPQKIAASETFDLIGTASSGNRGHAGRPGQVGGSAPSDGGGEDHVAALTTKGTGESLNIPLSETPDLGSTRPTPLKVHNVADAVSAIIKGQVVEIQDVRHVHTVLSKLAAMAREAKEKGENAPTFDLCKVSVPGTNLFCGSPLKTKEFPNGVPRIEMPQFKGKTVPGSPADKMQKNKWGSVDVTNQFVAHLTAAGIKTSEEHPVSAASLKATQMDMKGGEVARMMSDKTFEPGKQPVFVSNDGYVLDGHHRWAAVVGRDAEDGRLGESTMNVIVIDAPMSELYFRAKHYADEIGIAPKAADLHGYAARIFALMGRDRRFLLDGAGWEEGEHPRDNTGKFDESSGGASDAKAAGSKNASKEATAKEGWKGESRSFPSTQAKTAKGSESAPPKGTQGTTDGKPTGPTTTDDAKGGVLKAPASLLRTVDRMPPDERDALTAGYAVAQKQKNFKGSIEDFFAEQVALYRYAQEGDPRLLTWFYGDTLTAVQNDPEGNAHIEKVKAQQQGPGLGETAGAQTVGTEFGNAALAPDTDTASEAYDKAHEGELDKTLAGIKDEFAEKKSGGGGGGKEKTPTAGKGGEAGAVKANVMAVMGGMAGDESQALNAGYATAQASGYKGTIEDYFVQQVALYQYAPEGDPRLGTFFYGDTLSKATSDPALMAQVQTVIAQQKAPAPKPVKKAAVTQPAAKPIAQLFWDRVTNLYGTQTSGNYGHAGRPGQVGGSAPSNGNGSGGDRTTALEVKGEKPKDLSPDEKAALPHTDKLIVSKTAPPKDKPVTMVFGGSFNPPHAGHVLAMNEAVRLMEEAGYTVSKIIIAPVGDVLLKKKLGAKAYPLKDRVAIAERMFTDPRFEVSSGPGDETDNWPKDQKLKRTQLANWAQKRNEGTTVVNITGEDAVPGRENIEGFPSVFEGDKGTSHEGYHYLVVKREEKAEGTAGASSTKIRAAIKSGDPVPHMTPEAEAYLRQMLKNNPSIELSFFDETWMHLYGTASSGNYGHAGRPGQVGGSAPSDGGGSNDVTTALEGEKLTGGMKRAGDAYGQFVEPTDAEVQHYADKIRNDKDASDIEKENAEIFGRAEAINAAEMAAKGATEQRFANGRGDSAQYTKEYLDARTGELTTRSELHDEVYAEKTEKAPMGLKKPLAIILGGLTAAGKSTFVDSLKDHVNMDDFVQVNADEMKDELPEYNGENAAVVHEESSFMAKQLLALAQQNRQNFIYDATMGSAGTVGDNGMLGMVERLKAQGYDVQVMFMDVDVDTSVHRSMNRYKEAHEKGADARYVPGEIIRGNAIKGHSRQAPVSDGGASKPRKTYEAVKASGLLSGPNDGYIMIDNRGPEGPTSFPPRTPEGRGGGKVIERSGNLVIPESGLKPAEHGE